MKTKILSFLFVLILLAQTSLAQQSNMQYFRDSGQAGLNVFETSKDNTVEFNGLFVKVGGDFAIQFQAIDHLNTIATDTLVELSENFNLPTANLNLDVQLADGMRMHLRTYLSSKHHEESWVKGGHMQIDKLDFISDGFLSEVMEVTTLRFGMDEINYGDVHFRRSDNAAAIYNPFVGNYIMDAFTTEPFGEVTVQSNGLLGVLGFSNGRLNQSPLPGDDGIVIFGKLGYDDQINEDLRVRITGSVYSSSDKGTRDYLYGGDRSGSRYYLVLESMNTGGSDFQPRYNPGYASQTAFQINPFVKFNGLEFFGVYEMVSNGNSDAGGEFTQVGGELLYRFGANENVYLGGRYNSVSGNKTDLSADLSIDRINIGAGAFLTKNVLVKLEYVKQKWEDPAFQGTKFEGAEFDGAVLEAVIGF